MIAVSKIMRAWNACSHCIAGILGGFMAVGILHWFSLPDHNTIDMLSFTESAFGIGMTVIALVFSLVLVNQVKEIDRRFDEKNEEIDNKLTNAMQEFDEKTKAALEKVAQLLLKIEEERGKGHPSALAASGSIVGPYAMTHLGTSNYLIIPGYPQTNQPKWDN
jgi:hypothetical protein